jgi:hypothetical protein
MAPLHHLSRPGSLFLFRCLERVAKKPGSSRASDVALIVDALMATLSVLRKDASVVQTALAKVATDHKQALGLSGEAVRALSGCMSVF